MDDVAHLPCHSASLAYNEPSDPEPVLARTNPGSDRNPRLERSAVVTMVTSVIIRGRRIKGLLVPRLRRPGDLDAERLLVASRSA